MSILLYVRGDQMPCIKDYINYGTQGICLIEDIRTMKFRTDQSEREYYVIRPVYQENSRVFVPKDNTFLVEKMRPVMSADEIDSVIMSVKDKKFTWISEHRKCAMKFGEILSKRDEKELLILVSSLYLHSKETEKKLSGADERILKEAESIIEMEFSFSLHVEPKEIGEYIRDKLGVTEAPLI